MAESETAGNAAASEQAPRPGIYLEQKTGSIGTGGTAKTAQYRNFWATLSINEESAAMVLLDDDFRPTAIRETFPVDTLRGGSGWHYIAEGEKRYARLRPYLDKMLAQAAAAPKPQAAAQKPAASGSWWNVGASGQTGAAHKKAAAGNLKKNWWDK